VEEDLGWRNFEDGAHGFAVHREAVAQHIVWGVRTRRLAAQPAHLSCRMVKMTGRSQRLGATVLGRLKDGSARLRWRRAKGATPLTRPVCRGRRMASRVEGRHSPPPSRPGAGRSRGMAWQERHHGTGVISMAARMDDGHRLPLPAGCAVSARRPAAWPTACGKGAAPRSSPLPPCRGNTTCRRPEMRRVLGRHHGQRDRRP
jgi:hypothetical protein